MVNSFHFRLILAKIYVHEKLITITLVANMETLVVFCFVAPFLSFVLFCHSFIAENHAAPMLHKVLLVKQIITVGVVRDN